MKELFDRSILLLFFLGAFFTPMLLQAEEASPRIYAAGDLRGEIRPCGCSEEGDMGGLLRRGHFLAEIRKQTTPILYVDLGNNFPVPSDQGHLKVELIQSSFKVLKPDLILIGPNELNYGFEYLDTSLPYFASNVLADWPVQKQAVFDLGGASVQVWGYVSPEFVYQNPNDPPKVQAVGSELLEQWKKAQAGSPADFHLLLFRGVEPELAQFQKSGIFDQIIAGSNNDDELKQVLTMDTKVGNSPAIPTKGQGVSHFSVDQPQKVDTHWLRTSTPDHPEVVTLFEAYDAQVKELFFANLDKMNQVQQNSPFGGVKNCQSCHLQAHQIWSESRHAGALATLKKVGKHFDPECLECHVVGLNKNGFLSEDLTPGFANVQCENCHGASKAHMANPTIHPELEPGQQCTTCHVGSHSPNFNFENYWPKIQHGMEGSEANQRP